MELAGSSALITGGASGLGAATARRLAGQGAHVVIADLNREELRKQPPRCRNSVCILALPPPAAEQI